MTEAELIEKVARAIDPGLFAGEIERDCDYPAARRRLEAQRSAVLGQATAALAAIRETHEVVPFGHAERMDAEDRIARTRERIKAGARPVGLKRFEL